MQGQWCDFLRMETFLQMVEMITSETHGIKVLTGADPGFLDRGFKLAEGGSICAVWQIFPEIPHENEII